MKIIRGGSEQLMKSAALGLELMLILSLAACAYALHPVTPPTQVRLKVIARSPELYGVRLQVNGAHDYSVPADGRVTLDVPAYRAPCTVYLFGILILPNHLDPYTATTLDVFASGKIARQLSLQKISALPLDVDGYHLLKLSSAKHAPNGYVGLP